MFFDATPNFLYPDFFEAGKYKLSKNLFRRIRPRDSFNAAYATAKKYTILPGETPDSIAAKAYNDPEWYWTILILNNITDIRTQWPLDPDEFEKYIQNKYGEYENKPRHWETNEVKDSYGNVVLERGIIVEMYMGTEDQLKPNYWPQVRNPLWDPNDPNTTEKPWTQWTFTYYDQFSYESNEEDPNPNYENRDTIVRSSEINTVTAEQNLTLVTNREYEYELNELKREIYLPKSNYLDLLAIEAQKLLAYDTKYKMTREGYRISEEP